MLCSCHKNLLESIFQSWGWSSCSYRGFELSPKTLWLGCTCIPALGVCVCVCVCVLVLAIYWYQYSFYHQCEDMFGKWGNFGWSFQLQMPVWGLGLSFKVGFIIWVGSRVRIRIRDCLGLGDNLKPMKVPTKIVQVCLHLCVCVYSLELCSLGQTKCEC